LFDEKILRPDQTMGELLDSIPYYWKGITIKQLAAHQSGIWIADFSKAKPRRKPSNWPKRNAWNTNRARVPST
jgi:CubicO group peptidase (beta-lactamase class C family)